MARKLRTNIPITQELLKPAVPDLTILKEKGETIRKCGQSSYNQHHTGRELEPLFLTKCKKLGVKEVSTVTVRD